MKPVGRTICLLKDPRFGTRVLSGVFTEGALWNAGTMGSEGNRPDFQLHQQQVV